MLAASTMIGHEVKYKDADGVDQTGVVTSVKVTSNGPALRIGDTDISVQRNRRNPRQPRPVNS